MKSFTKLLSFVVLAFICLSVANAQNSVSQSQTYTATTVATVQPTLPLASNYPVHTITVVTTGTAVGTVQLQQCTTALIGSCSNLTGSTSVNVAVCTIANPCTQTVQGQTPAFGAFTITLGTCTTCTVQVTYTASAYSLTIGNIVDGFYFVPINGNCGAALTTGAFAANPANAGATAAPIMVRAAAGVQYLQVTTSAAASALTVDCDLTPPSRLTAGKGITVTGYNFYYGNQTSALTSITTPVVNTITWPVPPSATPLGTVATAGGTITLSPAAPTLTTTTLGQCNAFNASFQTPILINSSSIKLETTIVLNQTVAAATVYQVCGLAVLYQNNPI